MDEEAKAVRCCVRHQTSMSKRTYAGVKIDGTGTMYTNDTHGLETALSNPRIPLCASFNVPAHTVNMLGAHWQTTSKTTGTTYERGTA